MEITNQTTIKDVERCPFIGIVDSPMFMHCELDEVSNYEPFSLDKVSRVVMNTKPIQIFTFRNNYRDLVTNTQNKGGMVYFYPTVDGKIVHRDCDGEYVRMAQVKLTNYHFNQKVYENVRQVFEPKIVENPQKNYKYILIRR